MVGGVGASHKFPSWEFTGGQNYNFNAYAQYVHEYTFYNPRYIILL